MALLVLDIGGTYTKYGVWTENKIKSKDKFNTPLTWREMKKFISEIKDQFISNYKIKGVAFSVPGAPNLKTGKIEGESLVPYLHNFPIKSELEEALNLPVSFENDANCAALAELTIGSAKDNQNVLFIVLGTGVGGAISFNGNLVKGHNLYAGEFGFMLLNDNKNFGELATAVSMAKRYSDRKKIDSDQVTGEKVFYLANKGDLVAIDEVNRFFKYLALGLYNVVTVTNPEKVIIGGGVSNLEGFKSYINEAYNNLVKNLDYFPFKPIIDVAYFKNDSNLIGAALNFKKLYDI